MQINRDYEPTISVKDLFFHLCYRWRSILIAALVGAILLGAYQYLSVQKTHNEGKLTTEEKQYEIDLQYYRDSVINAQNNIRTYTKLIQEKEDYMNDSVYMSLDSKNEWVAIKRFSVKVDQAVLDALPESVQEDPANYVMAVYVYTLKSDLDSVEMEALLGTGKKEYINELVSISLDNTTNTITIQVIGESEEKVTGQLEYFVNRLYTVSGPIAQEVCAHTLLLVIEDCYSRTDSDLSSKQDENNQQIISWQESLKKQREALNELEERDEPVPPGKHVVKYAVIGFILGAFLLAAIYAVKYICGGKLNNVGEISERYGLPVYGEFAHSRARRPGKGLDKLFEKWEFKHAVTDAQVVESTVSALLRERFAGKKILLAGTCAQRKLDALGGSLSRHLSGACEISSQGDLPVNANAVSASKDADAVILVEEKYVSRIASIGQAAEQLGIADVNLVGCIIP